ncbi:hypothetical protein MPSEU_000990600 [Mayamaea pseudoterrestris]|nr:hypothetical protein MPSEU_000990600 [Mayamaea pseudoterrestris]
MMQCLSRMPKNGSCRGNSASACHARRHFPKFKSTLSKQNAHHFTSSASKSDTSASLFSKIRDMWNSGTILIGIGGAGVTLLLLDRTLQYYDDYNRQQTTESMAASLQIQQQQRHADLMDKYKNHPALFECTVEVVYEMGGTHGLTNVRQNQVLQVLQEGVGPNKQYNLCRTIIDEDHPFASIGWYPMSFLAKKVERKRKWWQLW